MWIATTMAAVFLQLGRNTVSKALSRELSPLAVSLARFLPGFPLALVGLGIDLALGGRVGAVGFPFLGFCFLMGLCQALANVLLIKLFTLRSFALSVSLVKLETVFLALLALPMLGDTIRPLEWAGIAAATAGLLAAAVPGKRVKAADAAVKAAYAPVKAADMAGGTTARPTEGTRAATGAAGNGGTDESTAGGAIAGRSERPSGEGGAPKASGARCAAMAAGSGLLLALSGIFLKMAYARVDTDGALTTVLLALPIILAIQSALLLALMGAKGELGQVATAARKPGLPLATGALSAAGSFCWFLSFSLASLQAVRTLGQSEFILACLVSALLLKERLRAGELAGIALVAAGGLMAAWS